jgi:MFS transporter, PPP family, 3-phenylpropionic acid transporter
MDPKKSIRLNYFFCLFAMGSAFPYLAPWFKETLGVSNRELGILLAIRPAVALLGQPFWSMVADTTGHRSRIASILAMASALTFPLVFFGTGIVTVVAALALSAFFITPLNSISDTLTFDCLGHEKRNHFGRFRIFASLGYFAAVASVGTLYDRTGLAWLFPLFAAGMLLAAASVGRVPSRAHPVSFRDGGRALAEFLQKRNVRWFLAAMMVSETANQMAYMYLSVFAKQLGANNAQVGWIWAAATGAEMVTMFFMVRIIRRAGLKKILFLGTFFVLFRWAPFAAMNAWWQLLPFQLVHIVTLTFVYVGAVIFMDTEASSKIRFSAQAFYSTFVLNGANILGSCLGGEISQYFGYRALFVISGILGVAASAIVLFFVHEPGRGKTALPGAPSVSIFPPQTENA